MDLHVVGNRLGSWRGRVRFERLAVVKSVHCDDQLGACERIERSGPGHIRKNPSYRTMPRNHVAAHLRCFCFIFAVISGTCVMIVIITVIGVPGLDVLMMICRSHNRTWEYERDGHQQCETQPDHEQFIKVPVTGGSIAKRTSSLAIAGDRPPCADESLNSRREMCC